jgi:hypothetical protein
MALASQALPRWWGLARTQSCLLLAYSYLYICGPFEQSSQISLSFSTSHFGPRQRVLLSTRADLVALEVVSHLQFCPTASNLLLYAILGYLSKLGT